MEKLTLEASRYTDKHENEFMLVNTGLGVCAFVIGLYLTFYILQIFRLRIGRIQTEIKNVQHSIEQGQPITSPEFHQPQHQDELTELEHDLKMMVQRLSQEISNRQEIEQQLLVLANAKQYDKAVGDLVNYMHWMAEPAQNNRVRLGIWVLLFLAGFTYIAWRLNTAYWKDIK